MNLKTALKSIFLSVITLFSFTNIVYAQDSQISVQVVASGQPVIDSEPEFTVGLENTIYWNEADLAVEYYAEISTDGSFGIILDNSGWIAQQTYNFEDLEDDTKYYYRVKSRNVDDGESLWSDVVFSTQDDNSPTSNVLDLSEETNIAEFTLNIDYFDQTSGVIEITLFYRKDDGDWISYGNFPVISEISFNSNLSGGDGLYEFYTSAKDLVGNIEYESAHTDASTVVDTTIPVPVYECGNGVLEPGESCDDGNLNNGDGCSSVCEIEDISEPEPIPEPEPEPIVVPESYVFITKVDGFQSRDLNDVIIYNNDFNIEGLTQSLQKLDYSLRDSSNVLLFTDYVRSDELGEWQISLSDLNYGKYVFEVSFVKSGTEYNDLINIIIEPERIVEVCGYSIPDSYISAFYNNTWIDLGKTNSDGTFLFDLYLHSSYEGKIIFKNLIEEGFVNISVDYEKGSDLEDLLFPPILTPSSQTVPLNYHAKFKGFTIPNSKINIYVNDIFFDTFESDSTGIFTFYTGKFTELDRFEITADVEKDDSKSELSTPSSVYVKRFNIPYLYKIGSLVDKHFGLITNYSILISQSVTIFGLFLTIFSGILLSIASTIVGYYNLLHDWRSLWMFLRPKSKVKFQIAGVDMGNKEGLLYFSDPSSGKIVFRVVIDSKGIGYSKPIQGIYNVCYIATRNISWFRSAVFRRSYITAYMLNNFMVKIGADDVNIVFDGGEELFIYPFTKFEKWFDRMLLFLILPITILSTVFSILSFIFIADYSSLVFIVLGIILILINILMIGYRKTFLEKIKWDGY